MFWFQPQFFMKKHFCIWSNLGFISWRIYSLLRRVRHNSKIWPKKRPSKYKMTQHVIFHQKWLKMKKCSFRKNWGQDQTPEVKGRFLVVKVKFLKKRWKKEDQCTSILPQADWPELPYEVDFWRNRFAQNIAFQKSWRFWLFWKVVWGVFEEISMSL